VSRLASCKLALSHGRRKPATGASSSKFIATLTTGKVNFNLTTTIGATFSFLAPSPRLAHPHPNPNSKLEQAKVYLCPVPIEHHIRLAGLLSTSSRFAAYLADLLPFGWLCKQIGSNRQTNSKGNKTDLLGSDCDGGW